MVLAGVSTGKLQIRMFWLSSFSIRQFDWLRFLSIVCELSTKIGTVRDPSECADASKVATKCRTDACGSYINKALHSRCPPDSLCKPEQIKTLQLLNASKQKHMRRKRLQFIAQKWQPSVVVRLTKYNVYRYIGCIIDQCVWSGPLSLVVMMPD